jgi:hypothetical protein
MSPIMVARAESFVAVTAAATMWSSNSSIWSCVYPAARAVSAVVGMLAPVPWVGWWG